MTVQDRITIGGFISLGALVVALGGLMFVQIDGVETRLNSRIDGVEERLNSRIDEGEARMARLEEAVRELGERMARFEGTLSAAVAPVGPNETPDDEPGRERLPPGRP